MKFSLQSLVARNAALSLASKPGDHVFVDLKLDPRLTPLSWEKFQKGISPPKSTSQLANSLVEDGLIYAIGSSDDEKNVYNRYRDLGMFGAVFEAWKNHWILRTRPDDWWFPVACRIAKAVNEAARHEGLRELHPGKVRELFVNHDGKETIAVELPAYTIFDANCDDLFAAVGSQLEQRIKIPEYAKAMQNDFSTSGSTHTVASQINLMSSLQEFFMYEMICCGCGLRALEMKGSVEDWEALFQKLQRVRTILEPIQSSLRLSDSWWDHVADVFQNLALTRRSPDNPTVSKFWINVLCDTTGTRYVGGGGSMPGRPVKVKAYDGWLIRFLTDREKILAQDLESGSKDLREKLSGFNKVAMKVSLTWCNPSISDETTLIAGMVGYKIYKDVVGDDDEDGKAKHDGVVPSVEPHHMWAMLATPTSPIRIGNGTTKDVSNVLE